MNSTNGTSWFVLFFKEYTELTGQGRVRRKDECDQIHILKELIKVFLKLTLKFLIISLNFGSCTLGIGDTNSAIISPNSSYNLESNHQQLDIHFTVWGSLVSWDFSPCLYAQGTDHADYPLFLPWLSPPISHCLDFSLSLSLSLHPSLPSFPPSLPSSKIHTGTLAPTWQ